MRFRETFFTALQQEDINDLLRVSFPVQINRVFITLASDYPFLPSIAGTLRKLLSAEIFLDLLLAHTP